MESLMDLQYYFSAGRTSAPSDRKPTALMFARNVTMVWHVHFVLINPVLVQLVLLD